MTSDNSDNQQDKKTIPVALFTGRGDIETLRSRIADPGKLRDFNNQIQALEQLASNAPTTKGPLQKNLPPLFQGCANKIRYALTTNGTTTEQQAQEAIAIAKSIRDFYEKEAGIVKNTKDTYIG